MFVGKGKHAVGRVLSVGKRVTKIGPIFACPFLVFSKDHRKRNMNDICESAWYLEIVKHKDSTDKYKSEDCSVLEALNEIICSTKGDRNYRPSPVEFFSCIMSTLAGSSEHCRSVSTEQLL